MNIKEKTNILIANDSACEGNEPSKVYCGEKKPRRIKLEGRESTCEENLNREEWISHHLSHPWLKGSWKEVSK